MKGTLLAIGNGGTIFSEMKNILKHCYNDGVVLTNVVVLNACNFILRRFLLQRSRLMRCVKYYYVFCEKRRR